MENTDEFGDVFQRGGLRGYIRKDTFGRLYVDACASTEDHLTKATVPEGEERPRCRKYLDDVLVPERVLGEYVEIQYTTRIVYCTEGE